MPITYRFKGVTIEDINPETHATTTAQLTQGCSLGQGAFGLVSVAEVNSASYSGPNLIIKVQSYSNRRSHEEELRDEASFFEEVNGGPVHIGFNERESKSYLVCKRMPGITLDKFLESPDTPLVTKLIVIHSVFSQLEQKVHRKGIIHGDLKPNNILVNSAEDGVVQVSFIDFGLSYRKSGYATTFNLEQGRKSYQHPERIFRRTQWGDFSEEPVAAKAYHDTFSLCYCLREWEWLGLKDKLTETAAFRAGSPSIAKVKTTLNQLLIAALSKDIETFANSLPEARKKLFVQLAATSQITEIIGFIRENAQPASHIRTWSANMFQLADLPRRYRKQYQSALFKHCLTIENLVTVTNKDSEELRAWLPAHFNKASTELLTEAINKAKEKLNQRIEQTLSTSVDLDFSSSPEELREQLPQALQEVNNDSLQQVINKKRKEALEELRHDLGAGGNRYLRLTLLAYGRLQLRQLLQASAKYRKLAPRLTEIELNDCWENVQGMVSEKEDGDARTARALTCFPSRYHPLRDLWHAKQLTGIEFLRVPLATRNAIPATRDTLTATTECVTTTKDSIIATMNETAMRLQKNSALTARLTLEEFTGVGQQFEEVRQHWEDRWEALNNQDTDATYNDWLQLETQIKLSTLIVKGFHAYDKGSRSVNDNYRDFALNHPGQHSLQRLCQLVHEETGYGQRLHKGSFFICILDQQPTDQFINPLYAFIFNNRLGRCFRERHYRTATEHRNATFFTSPARASRDEILEAVRRVASEEVNTLELC